MRVNKNVCITVISIVVSLCSRAVGDGLNVSSLFSNITLDGFGTANGSRANNDPNIYFNPMTFATSLMREMVNMYSPTYPSSATCLNQRLRVLLGLAQQKIWAMQFIDSLGKPSSGFLQGNTVFMGNYDLCVSIDDEETHDLKGSFFRMVFEVKLPPSALQMVGRLLMLETGLPNVFWYICLPSACGQKDAKSIGTEFAKQTGVKLVDALLLESKSPADDTCFILAVVILSILGLACLIGTVIDVFAGDESALIGAADVGIARENEPRNNGVVVTGIRVIHDNGSPDFVTPTVGQQVLPRRVSRLSDVGVKDEVADDLNVSRRLSNRNSGNQKADGVDELSRRLSKRPSSHQQSVEMDDLSRRLSHKLSSLQQSGGVDAAESHSLNSSSSQSSISEKGSDVSKRIASQKRAKARTEMWRHIFLSFSLRANLADILKAKHTPGDIRCLHGIRVLTISWVILGHCFFQTPQFGNLTTFMDMSKWWTFQAIISGPFSVDTFFMLSGCLVAFLFLRTAQKFGKLTVNHVVLYYVHRVLRLTPLYALIILFYTGVTPYLERGPYAKTVYDRDINCRETWWWNILYISNFQRGEDMCITWSWYLPNDMQFYAVAPLALIPIALGYLYPGVFVTLLMLACHIVSYAIIDDKYDAALYKNVGDFMSKLYIKPWTRVGPYAVGILLGVLLFKRQNKQKLNKMVATIGWVLALAGGLTLVYVSHDNYKDNGIKLPKWGHASTVAYETLKSPVWAACVGWVVFACFSNCGGFIDSFLSWQAWIPLSKLTFGVYLVHMIIMIYFNNNAKILGYFSYHYVIERFLSVFLLSYGFSLVFSLLIETPVRNLIRPSPGKSRPKQEQISTPTEANEAKLPANQKEAMEDLQEEKHDAVDAKFHLRRVYLPQVVQYHNRGFESDNLYMSTDEVDEPVRSGHRW